MMDTSTRGPGLTRAVIIQTALGLLDQVGLDGLTVRRLAAELGVQSPALYWHFRTKQELLDGMAEAIIVSAGMGPPRDGESWRDWLAHRARTYRQSLLAHRDGARIITNARQLSLATIRRFDLELTAMVDRGFTPVLALRTITALTHYVNGSVLQQQTVPLEPAEPAGNQLATLTGLPDQDAPAMLIAALRDGGPSLGEDVFEHGLRALINGAAAALLALRDGNDAGRGS